MSIRAIPALMDNRHLRILGLALAGLWVILLAAQVFRIAVATPPSFDGSMNLEIARSLSQGQGYRRLYAERQLFPHEIQTNAPYILPQAVVFDTFGVGIAQSEVVNIAYLFALISLVGLLAFRYGGMGLGILAPAVVLVTPQLLRYGMAGYGEVPALTWFMAAVFIYFDPEKQSGRILRCAVCGTFLALALLTKTVMLLCVGVFVAFAVSRAILDRKHLSRQSLYSAFAMSVSALIPVAAFEKWKEVSLGGYRAWEDWWHYEGHAILFQAGVQHTRLPSTAHPIADKLLLHLSILAQTCQVPTWVAAAWVAIVLVAASFAVLLAARDRRLMAMAIVLGVASLYFVWWLAITPDEKAWPRRVLDGIICANVGLVLLIGHLARPGLRRAGALRLVAILAASVVPGILLAQGTMSILTDTPPDNSRLLKVVQEVKDLPKDAYLFGIGWNSSPLISVLSGRHFIDFSDVPKSELDVQRPMYLVRSRGLPSTQEIDWTFSIYGLKVDAPSSNESSNDSQEASNAHIEVADTLVYKLPKLHPEPIRLDKGPVRSRIQYTDDYPYLKGPYPAEPGNGRWLRTDNVVVLQPSQSETFFLTGYAVAQKHYEYAHPLAAIVSFNDCFAPPQPIPTKATFTLRIHVPQYCKLDVHEPWSVRIQINNVVESGVAKDEREMSVLFKSMGFY